MSDNCLSDGLLSVYVDGILCLTYLYLKFKYPDFIFLGPVPIDFDEVVKEVANINLKTLEERIKRNNKRP